jgi:DNA-directed RNA polymerase sigma subunit (sigma70/sigma32)
MDYKLEVDRYFDTRIKDLKDYYYKFCSPKEKEFFGEMVSELYLHSISNLDKIKGWLEKDEYHYYAIKYIYNQRNWSNTSFKKMIIIPDSIILDNLNDIDFSTPSDIMEDMEEVYRREYETNLKLEFLSNAVSHLDYYERYVYDEYFIKKKTLRALGCQVGLSHISIHRIVKRIKTKLHNIIQKQIKK